MACGLPRPLKSVAVLAGGLDRGDTRLGDNRQMPHASSASYARLMLSCDVMRSKWLSRLWSRFEPNARMPRAIQATEARGFGDARRTADHGHEGDASWALWIPQRVAG